jgi:uncharacterized protein DUF2628
MSVYSVFEPPPRDNDGAPYAERFAFVCDGFSWAAFIFGPLWMLRHRLVLALALWVVLVVAIALTARVLAVPLGSEITVIVLLGLLLGFEASTLRRWTLQRRGWRDLGIVVADDFETAERRFFDDWVMGNGFSSRQGRSRHWSTVPRNDQGPDVIGLFPDPGVNR